MEKNFLDKNANVVANCGYFNVFGKGTTVTKPQAGEKTTKIGNGCSFGGNVRIAANCVIGNNVVIGDNIIIPQGTVIGNNVTINGIVRLGEANVIGDNTKICGIVEIGEHNMFMPNCVIGVDNATASDHGMVKIGNSNTFHTGVTVVRASGQNANNATTIGDNCSLFENTVIKSNVVIGSDVCCYPQCTILEGAHIGNDASFISSTLVKAQSFIGDGAMIDAQRIDRDIPPFAIVLGENVVGINRPLLMEKIVDITDSQIGWVSETVRHICTAISYEIAQGMVNRERLSDNRLEDIYLKLFEFVHTPHAQKVMKWR